MNRGVRVGILAVLGMASWSSVARAVGDGDPPPDSPTLQPPPSDLPATAPPTSPPSSPAVGSTPPAAPTPAKKIDLADAPTAGKQTLSPYEQETLSIAQKKLHFEIDPSPEGKTIEGVDVVRLEVVEERDPVPNNVVVTIAEGPDYPLRPLINSLHFTSRDFVIRREVLLDVGDPYVPVLAQETSRNLRRLAQLSVVVVAAVKGKDKDKVRIVVVTKDVWSLRLAWDIQVTPGGVESLLVTPQETNLLGTHHTVQTRFFLLPESYTLGALYKVPRFGTSYVGASGSGSVVMNRRTGDPEGSSLGASVGQPLYTTRTEWAWSAGVSTSNVISRRYSNAALVFYDSPVTGGNDRIPFQYRSTSTSASVAGTRSFGWRTKLNIDADFGITVNETRTFDVARFDPGAVQEFVGRNLPVGETRIGPSISASTFNTDYRTILNFSTLALQEDVRLGPSASVTVYPVLQGLGSTRNVIGGNASAGFSFLVADAPMGASVSVFGEHDLDREGISDASYSASASTSTPSLGFGRFVASASFLNRFRNYLNSQRTLGGDGRLRGYPSSFYAGKDFVVGNLEFRSRPVQLLSCQFGAVAFFDIGDAMQGFDKLHLKESAGLGVRALFPQLNRVIFRIDLGFPLDRTQAACPTSSPCKIDAFSYFMAFEQAF